MYYIVIWPKVNSELVEYIFTVRDEDEKQKLRNHLASENRDKMNTPKREKGHAVSVGGVTVRLRCASSLTVNNML